MDTGRETAFDPSRHGPMADQRTAKVPQPSFLREMSGMLEEAQTHANNLAGRLRNNADSLMGSRPELAATGAHKPLPPVAGQVHQLLDAIRSVNSSLREAVDQLDRLDAL